MIIKKFLFVRADCTVRVGSRSKARPDEIAVPLNIDMGEGWWKVDKEQEINVTMPDIPRIGQAAS